MWTTSEPTCICYYPLFRTVITSVKSAIAFLCKILSSISFFFTQTLTNLSYSSQLAVLPPINFWTYSWTHLGTLIEPVPRLWEVPTLPIFSAYKVVLGILVGTTWTKADGAEDAADPGDTASWLQRLVTHPLQEGSRRDGTRGVCTGTEWPRWLCGHSLSHAKPGKWAKEAIWREKVWKTVYRERQSRMWLQSGRERKRRPFSLTALAFQLRFPRGPTFASFLWEVLS